MGCMLHMPSILQTAQATISAHHYSDSDEDHSSGLTARPPVGLVDVESYQHADELEDECESDSEDDGRVEVVQGECVCVFCFFSEWDAELVDLSALPNDCEEVAARSSARSLVLWSHHSSLYVRLVSPASCSTVPLLALIPTRSFCSQASFTSCRYPLSPSTQPFFFPRRISLSRLVPRKPSTFFWIFLASLQLLNVLCAVPPCSNSHRSFPSPSFHTSSQPVFDRDSHPPARDPPAKLNLYLSSPARKIRPLGHDPCALPIRLGPTACIQLCRLARLGLVSGRGNGWDLAGVHPAQVLPTRPAWLLPLHQVGGRGEPVRPWAAYVA